jgi:ABC-type dipeptide/oligopeptide/nickel transport system permease component
VSGRVVGYRSSALITRITRSAVLEVMREDYIRTAWAKGQNGRVVIWRHALKNAMLPVITVIGIEFAFLIGGLVVTETVFNLPGVARVLVQAILWRDYPVVQNLVMFIAVVVILSNLLVRIAFRHVMPNTVGPFIVLMTAQLGSAILTEAALSFLGLGVPEPWPSWGRMLSVSAAEYAQKAPYLVLFPGIAISLAVFASNLLGDALRDTLDPRLRGA